jgi:hypothetical protein
MKFEEVIPALREGKRARVQSDSTWEIEMDGDRIIFPHEGGTPDSDLYTLWILDESLVWEIV